MNTITILFRMIIDALLMRDPVKTVMGSAFGVLVYVIIIMGAPYILTETPPYFQDIAVYCFAIVGTMLFNIPQLFKGHRLSPELENALAFIEQEYKLGVLTRAEANALRKSLVRKVVANAHLNHELAARVKQLEAKPPTADPSN